MFCFPYEQILKCADAMGSCGDQADTAYIQDQLTGALIGLARATEGNEHMITDSTAAVIVEGLLATSANANFDKDSLLSLLDRADQEKRKLVPSCYICASPCGRTNNYDMENLWNTAGDIRSLKTQILSGIRDMAVHIHHAAALGRKDDTVDPFLYKALFAIGMDDWGIEELQPIVLELDDVKLKCMAMLG